MGVIAQSMIPDHRKAGLKTADANDVGIPKRGDILIEAEVVFGFSFQVRRDVIAASPKAGALGVVWALEADEVVEADELILRVDAPDTCGSGGGFNVLQLGVKKEIVIEIIASAGAQVVGEPTLFLHCLGHAIGNPLGKFQTLGQCGLVRLPPRRHFLQGHLFPGAFPNTGIPIQHSKGGPPWGGAGLIRARPPQIRDRFLAILMTFKLLSLYQKAIRSVAPYRQPVMHPAEIGPIAKSKLSVPPQN